MEASVKHKPINSKFHKIAYAVFVLAGICFLIRKDFGTAIIFWGLAPIFDPFDSHISLGKRPAWQQVWLMFHVVITISCIVLNFTQ